MIPATTAAIVTVTPAAAVAVVAVAVAVATRAVVAPTAAGGTVAAARV